MPDATQMTIGNTIYDIRDTSKIPNTEKGAAGGVATLDSGGKVPVGQLPVDSAPTSGSGNPVSSGGVYTALSGKASNADVTATQGMIATVEQTSTASKAYAVGDYLVYQGTLYRVTSAIAVGGTINPGGNCESTTVGAQLQIKALNFNYVHTEALAAGAYGYYAIPVPGELQGKTIVSTNISPGQIAASAGYQLTGKYTTGNTIYLSYYTPQPLTKDNTVVTLTIAYI